MIDRIEISEMMRDHGQRGLTVVDYVRRTASEMRMTREATDANEWAMHFARATGFAAMITECPIRSLTYLSEELNELAQTDPDVLQAVFVVHNLAQTLRRADKDMYLDAIKEANAIV